MRAIGIVLVLAVSASTSFFAYKTWDYRRMAMEAQYARDRLILNSLELKNLANRNNEKMSSLERFAGEIVKRDAGLSMTEPTDNRQAMLAVRDYVYRNLEADIDETPDGDDAKKYAVLGSDKNGMFCGGASQAFFFALKSLGIQSRIIQLIGNEAVSGDDPTQTHVTVEVKLDGEWEISDPLFNSSIICDGSKKHLSVAGVFDCLSSGKSISAIPGKTRIPPLTLETAKVPYATYFVKHWVAKNFEP